MDTEEELTREILPQIPFQRRQKPDSFKKPILKSPINLDGKTIIEQDMGPLHFDSMWKRSKYAVISNSGKTVKLQLTSPATLKWKPVGEIAYQFEEVEFYWSDSGGGSCHAINNRKFDMEIVFSFDYRYEIKVPSDLIYQRVDLHHKYRRLQSALDESEKEELESDIAELEEYYDDLEDFTLDERYTHSEAREALSHRKPTDFNIKSLPQNIIADSDMDFGGGGSDGTSDEESNDPGTLHLDREIRFKKEKEIHELAATRFYPIYAERMANGVTTEIDDVEELLSPSFFLVGNRDQAVGNDEDDDDRKHFKKEAKQRLSEDTEQSLQIEALDAVKDDEEEEETFDPVLFPGDRDRIKERARRVKFKEERMKQQKNEMRKKMEWIRKHQISIMVNIAVMFEKSDKAPHYNLFSYLSQVKEPNSKVMVDGNLLCPFKKAGRNVETTSNGHNPPKPV